MTGLALVAVGEVDPEELAWLAGALGERFGVPVSRGEDLEPRAEWRSADTGQLNSNHVVDALIARDCRDADAPTPERWVLGVTEEDLFAPERTFVFGEAAQGGAWAVISLARLGEGTEGADGRARVRRRMLKEAVHELGHLAGLGHCERPECVMYASRTLEDTDRKGAVRCPACEAEAGQRGGG